MANRQRFHVGERVIINTGGKDSRGRIEYDQPPNPALKGCYLVAFDGGGHSQWMGAEHLRPVPPVPDCPAGPHGDDIGDDAMGRRYLNCANCGHEWLVTPDDPAWPDRATDTPWTAEDQANEEADRDHQDGRPRDAD